MVDFPHKNKAEKLIETVHAGAQLIPLGIGSTISSLVNSFIPNGFEKRKEDWLKCLAEKIDEMDRRLYEETNSFFNTEEGKTLILKSALAAISTHKKEKINTIRDVLLNTSIDDIVYDQKEILINIIIELEPYDIFILKLIIKYKDDFKEIDSYEKGYIFCQSNGFEATRDTFLLIMNKLREKSLIRISETIDGFGDVYSPDLIIGSGGMTDKPQIKITKLGSKLTSYITET